MPLLDLTLDELLATTRSVRKRLDLTRPVEPEIIRECLELAVQAPTGSNSQHWHFVVVTDAQKRFAIAELYRKSFAVYRQQPSPVSKLAPGSATIGTDFKPAPREPLDTVLHWDKW